MPKKRFSDEQIAFALKQAEAGTTVGEIYSNWTTEQGQVKGKAAVVSRRNLGVGSATGAI